MTGLTSLQLLNLTGCQKLSQKAPKPDHHNRSQRRPGLRLLRLGEDTSPIAPEENRQRRELVEWLCRALGKENWRVIRDKTALSYGDLISPFMKTLGQTDLVIVVSSTNTCNRLAA